MVDQIELEHNKIVDVDFGSPEFLGNAREIVAGWAQRPPFYIVSPDLTEVICGRYQDAYEVFTDVTRFSSELPNGRGFEKFDKYMGIQVLAQMDGEAHDRIRKLLMPAFSSAAMEHLEGKVTHIVDSMLDQIDRAGQAFDGMKDYGAKIIVAALLDAMLDLTEEQKQVFLDLHEVLPLTTFTKPGEPYPQECVAAFGRARQMVEAIIDERRAKPGNDFISQLIEARDEGDKLSDEELFNQTFTVCGAALSATSRAMGGVLYTLFSHPEQLQILKSDPSLMAAAMEECFRFASGGYFTFPRVATCDTEVGGTKIYKGMVVRPSPQAANLDPTVYQDPLRFDIKRNPKRILAFGTGPHLCIGNRLGRFAISIAISRLLKRFPNARLRDPEFKPVYGGAVGELRIFSLPMMTQ